MKKRPLALLLPLLLSPAIAEIHSINVAKIEGEQTISIFFEKPQTFTKEEANRQFIIGTPPNYYDEEGNYNPDAEPTPYTKGEWRLSKDGTRLSYSPIEAGSYIVQNSGYPDRTYQSLYLGSPSASINISGIGPVLPITQRALELETLGVEGIDVQFYAIENPAHFFKYNYINTNLSRWDLDRLRESIEPTLMLRYDLPKSGERLQKETLQLPIDKQLKAGAYLVTVGEAGAQSGSIESRIIFLTDIGLHLHKYDEKTLLVANHFSTLEPLKEGSVEIWREEKGKLSILPQECTFKEGACTIETPLKDSDILVVHSGEDRSILPIRERALDLNDQPTLGEAYQSQEIHLYSNRQLYRPGEEAIINLLLRSDEGEILPKQSLNLIVKNPSGRKMQNLTLHPEEVGFYQALIPFPIDADIGQWSIEVRTDPESKAPINSLPITIEQFTPERMGLAISKEEAPTLLSDSFSYDVEAYYLYGALADGNKLNATYQFQQLRTPFIGEPSWYVGGDSFNNLAPFFAYSPSDFNHEEEYQLDQEGRISIEYKPQLIDPENPSHTARPFPNALRVRGKLQVLDGAAPSATRYFTQDIWPVENVPVVKPLFDPKNLGLDQKAQFEIFAANMDGEITPKDLQLTLKYHPNYCLWIYSLSDGWSCESNAYAEIEELYTIKGERTPHLYEFDPNFWGRYELTITDLESGFETTFPITRNGWGEGDLPSIKPMALNIEGVERPIRLDGVVNQTITLDLPFDGVVSLLVEGNEPLHHQQISLKKGKNELSIPLDSKWRAPNLYLSAHLIGHDAKGEIQRAFGVRPIKIDYSDRHLEAKLDFKPITRSEAQFEVSVTVPNHQEGEQLYATLSITDQGILNLLPLENLSLFDRFFKQRGYGAEIIDYYNRLYKRSEAQLLTPKFGGDAAIAEEKPIELTEMKSLSLTSPLLRFEGNRLDYSFPLPDFNGEAKVVATIFSENRVGESEAQAIIRDPIVMDLIPPATIRVDDEMQLPLSLHNLNGKDEVVELSAKNEALGLDIHERFTLKEGERRQLKLPIKLTKNSFLRSEERIELTLKWGDEERHRTYRIVTTPKTPFRNLEIRRSRAEAGEVAKPNVVGVEIQKEESFILSRFPIIDVAQHGSTLLDSYLSSASLQLAHQLTPWISDLPAVEAERKRAYINYVRREEERESLQILPYDEWSEQRSSAIISRLLSMQNSNGLFKEWISDRQGSLSSSVEVIDPLIAARKKYPQLVSESLIDQALNGMKGSFLKASREIEEWGATEHTPSALYQAGWILAREGRLFNADLAALLKLQSAQEEMKSFSNTNRFYLGAALLTTGDHQRGMNLLNGVNFSHYNSEGEAIPYLGGVADVVMGISQLQQRESGGSLTPLSEKMVDSLNIRLSNTRYLSLKDHSLLIQIAENFLQDEPLITITIDGEERSIAAQEPFDAEGVERFTISEPLYTVYRAEGFPTKPISTQSFPVEIERHYHQPLTELKAGDRLLVTLKLKAKSTHHNILVEELIPSGFKLIPPRSQEEMDELAQSYGYRESAKFSEQYRDDRYEAVVTLSPSPTLLSYMIEATHEGSFQSPPTRLQSLTQPDLQAIEVYDLKAEVKAPQN